jgi:ABC-type uncharacterized transport system substrate-binding protein
LAAFREGLRETGYIEGQNVAIDYRWAEGVYNRLQALAADLVNRKVVAAIALANKLARMAWALMARGERYNYPVALRP